MSDFATDADFSDETARWIFAAGVKAIEGTSYGIGKRMFDKWIEGHDREVRRQALKGIETLMRQNAVIEDYYLGEWESGYRSACLSVREILSKGSDDE